MNQFFFKNAMVALMMSAGTLLYAQIPVGWSSFPTSTEVSQAAGPNSITTQTFATPNVLQGAFSSNKLSACKNGYVEALMQEGTLIGSKETELSSASGAKYLILGLDADGITNYPREMDFGILIRKAYPAGTYTLQAGLKFSFYTGAFTTVLYTSTITYTSSDIYRIEKSGGNIVFKRNGTTLGTTTAASTDLYPVAGVGSYSMSVNNIVCDFKAADACGMMDDNDWKGQGTGTLSPYYDKDNVYIRANVGIGVSAPTEKLEVGGKVKITTIDNDNALTKLLVADASGLLKYRDVSSLPEAMDWRTSTDGIPVSLSQSLYKKGKVGINIADPQASMHVLNGGCDNVPALRVTACDPMYGCSMGWKNGPLMLFENFAGSLTFLTVTEAGLMGLGTATPAYTLDVAGSGRINTAWVVSDQRFKKNIQKLKDPMEQIRRINGYSYEFRTDEFKEHNFSKGQQMGFLAQELKEVVPAAVDQAADGYYAVNYDAMVPLLVEALKAQDKKITELEQRLEQVNAGSKPSDITGKVQAVLYQNVPNPFSQNTEIRYMLPENVTDGRMLVFDMNGKQIKSIPLRPGKGSVTISGSELSVGMYLYSLIAGGQEIDTKRMILTE